ncbi:hypothetical protein [Maribellus sediminis]|uniref:hypothetical protein n=1 Tax=Maribellus sediminis TaxID=2696285 RepID=UPI00142FF375|nr:hypothetical protein [Maribellus sediminis]
MKKLMMLFMGLLFMGSMVLTSCRDDFEDMNPGHPANPIELPKVDNPIELPKAEPHVL